MLLSSFEVENFRSLKHFKLNELARVNLLVGKNNSGKTSVLEAIFSLLNIDGIHWAGMLEMSRDFDEDEVDFRYLFYNFDDSSSISLKIEYAASDSASKSSIKAEIRSKENSQSVDSDFARIRRPVANRRSNNNEGLSINVWQSEKSKPVRFEIKRAEEKFNTEAVIDSANASKFLDRGWNSTLGTRADVELLPTDVNLFRLSSNLEELTVNKQVDRLLRVVQRVDSRIKSIVLGGRRNIYLDLGDKLPTLSPINIIGEGVQKILSVIASIASSQGGTVLIDELDNGLHYSVLRVLWQGILEAAFEYDVQVIVTTHSIEALRHLTWVLNDEKGEEYRKDVAAYTLIRTKNDEVRSFRYDYEQLDFAMEHDVEVRN